MVDTYDTGGLRVSEAEHGQTGIPDAVLCDDVGLFSSFILFTVYLRGRAQYQLWNGNVLGGVCL